MTSLSPARAHRGVSLCSAAVLTLFSVTSLLAGCAGETSDPADTPAVTPSESVESSVATTATQDSSTASDPTTGFKVIDSGFGVEDDKYAFVVAEVRNQSREVGQAVTVTFNLLDKSGQVVASGNQLDAVSVKGQTMLVGTQIELDASSNAPVKVNAHLTVENNGAFSREPMSPFKVGKVSLIQEYGHWSAKFPITSTMNETLDSPQVRVACRNADGKIIGGGGSYSAVVAPKGTYMEKVGLIVSGKPTKCDVAVDAPPAWDGPSKAAKESPTISKVGAEAAKAFETWIGQFNNRDWKGQYKTLVPEQQKLFTQEQYIACRNHDQNLPTFVWKGVVGTETVNDAEIPGTTVKKDAILVKAKVAYNGVTVPISSHMIPSATGWQWEMTSDNIQGCQAFR